ncbi:MAG: hypothetical protein ACOYZ6_13905 [Chloroflexota bacterium]
MICIFFDETSDDKFKDYFGLSCAAVKHNYYGQIKEGFQKILLEGGWDPTTEFKGAYLFSASKGCTNIPVDKRVEMAEAVINLNVASKNARMKFAYFRKSSQNLREDYLTYIPAILERILKSYGRQSGQGKDLVSIYCDYRNDIPIEQLKDILIPVVLSNSFKLYEDIQYTHSNFHTVGILYADIVGYLMARIETIANDSELFESIPPEAFENNGKIKKMRTSLNLIDKIKGLSLYEIK